MLNCVPLHFCDVFAVERVPTKQLTTEDLLWPYVQVEYDHAVRPVVDSDRNLSLILEGWYSEDRKRGKLCLKQIPNKLYQTMEHKLTFIELLRREKAGCMAVYDKHKPDSPMTRSKLSHFWKTVLCMREPLGTFGIDGGLVLCWYQHSLAELFDVDEMSEMKHPNAEDERLDSVRNYLRTNFKFFMLAILNPLLKMHQAGLLHCDIKPGNYLFDIDVAANANQYGRPLVVLADLGSHRTMNDTTHRSGTTWQYKSPALFPSKEGEDKHKVLVATPATDLYSAVVLMVELVIGKQCYKYHLTKPTPAPQVDSPHGIKQLKEAKKLLKEKDDTTLENLIRAHKYVPFDQFALEYSPQLTEFLKRMAGHPDCSQPITTVEQAVEWINSQPQSSTLFKYTQHKHTNNKMYK